MQSKLSKVVEIEVFFFDDACKEPSSKVGVRPEDFSCLDKPIMRKRFPVRVVEATKRIVELGFSVR